MVMQREPIPAPGSFDLITRLDETMLHILAALTNQKSVAEKTSLLDGSTKPYAVKSYSLASARVSPGESLGIDGDHVLAATDGSLNGINLRLNTVQNDAVPLTLFNPVASNFYDLFLTNSAQAGKTLWLFIGREAATEATTGTMTVSTSQQFVELATDKDTHFTGALAQYAKEDEDLTGLLSNSIRITGIIIQSDQQLHYKLLLWTKDAKDDADLDTDKFGGEIDLDIPTYGIQIAGTNQYYMDVRNLHVDYIDEDSTQELHCSLMNMSVTAKIATTLIAVTGAASDDGGAVTGETTEANSAGANDMTLLPAVPAVNDAYYLGAAFPFSMATLVIGTQGDGTWTVAWEYYNGSTWVALAGVTDGTNAFQAAAGTVEVSFTQPADWGSTTIATIAGYWIRARVATYAAVVTQPLGTRAYINGVGEVKVKVIYETRT